MVQQRRRMEFFVKPHAGEPLTLRMCLDEKVEVLKRQIQDREGTGYPGCHTQGKHRKIMGKIMGKILEYLWQFLGQIWGAICLNNRSKSFL